jgi:hypothetical protein
LRFLFSDPPVPKRRKKKRRADAPLHTPGARLIAALRAGGSGPAVARLFDRLLAAIFAIAWISLGSQVDLLIGSRGLLPASEVVTALRSQDLSYLDAPSIFVRLGAADGTLHAAIGAGIALSVLAFAGVMPRLAFALMTLLYLSFATVTRTFLSFQWDNLLLECGMLAAILPRDRRAPWTHFLLRVALFKLYWESGVAKWQSPIHDWHNGSAMTFYYETAPIPARLGWYAHHLPAWWHAFEGWFTLFFELAVPLLIFTTRRARLFALATFTLFQVVNLSTASYGFFCYLALSLHVFLLDERDVVALRVRLVRRFPWLHRMRVRRRWLDLRIHRLTAWIRLPGLTVTEAQRRWIRGGAAATAVTAYLGISFLEALVHFSGSRTLASDLGSARETWTRLRLVNTYHLFAAITRDRIEPEVQTFDGTAWTAHDLRHKPGDPMRAPHVVAPHQPRVDFQLWFYGLAYRGGAPPWVSALLDRVCHEPAAVQQLFREPLPQAPESARMAFFRYHFTSPAERRATGAWWKREPAGTMKPVHCAHQ